MSLRNSSGEVQLINTSGGDCSIGLLFEERGTGDTK